MPKAAWAALVPLSWFLLPNWKKPLLFLKKTALKPALNKPLLFEQKTVEALLQRSFFMIQQTFYAPGNKDTDIPASGFYHGAII